jgi:hypothetical protein
MEIRNSHKAEVPCFDFESFSRKGFKELQVSEESGVVKYISIQASHGVHFTLFQQGYFFIVLCIFFKICQLLYWKYRVILWCIVIFSEYAIPYLRSNGCQFH